jgi:hypothetical protein
MPRAIPRVAQRYLGTKFVISIMSDGRWRISDGVREMDFDRYCPHAAWMRERLPAARDLPSTTDRIAVEVAGDALEAAE